MSDEAIRQNTFDRDEQLAVKWIVRNSDKEKQKQPFDCDTCNKPKGALSAKERRKKIHQTKRLYGCIGKAKLPFKFAEDHGIEELKTCPHKIFRESGIYHYFRAYSWYLDNGIFPHGDFEDQSEKLVQIFETIRAEHRSMQEESHEESIRESKLRGAR